MRRCRPARPRSSERHRAGREDPRPRFNERGRRPMPLTASAGFTARARLMPRPLVPYVYRDCYLYPAYVEAMKNRPIEGGFEIDFG
jgi:hypothetical protein